MLKQYQYKIQWLFNTNKGDVNNIKNVLKAIGVRSLTKITFRDANMKIISTYSEFIQHPAGYAEYKTMKDIKQAIKKDKRICAIELYRTN